MHYVIQLKTGRYLCHSHSNVAVIYEHYDPRLSFDLSLTNGKIVPITTPVSFEIYESGNYSNIRLDEKKASEEFLDAARAAIQSRERQSDDTVRF